MMLTPREQFDRGLISEQEFLVGSGEHPGPQRFSDRTFSLDFEWDPGASDFLDALVRDQARREVQAREDAVLGYFHGDEALARLWARLFRGTGMEVGLGEVHDFETGRARGFVVGMQVEVDLWAEQLQP